MASTTFTHEQAIKPGQYGHLSNLQGKSVLITGAASGIGEACMSSFVAAGAFVTFGDLASASDRATGLVSELGSDKVNFMPCDTRSWKDQAALFKTASSLHDGNIDIVFANAGISGSDPVFNDTSDPQTGEPVEPDLNILQTNLVGFMYTAKLALHYFARQRSAGGSMERDHCLIMTSSIAGYLDHNGAPQYSAAKFGTRGMMRSLRQVLPKQDARVNIIAPWCVRTASHSITCRRFSSTNVHGVMAGSSARASSPVQHWKSCKQTMFLLLKSKMPLLQCCILPATRS